MDPRVKCGGKTKLNTGYHPNRHLLELWKKHDEEAFRVEVVVEFDYRDDPSDPADHKDELEQLRDLYLERDGRVVLLWRYQRAHRCPTTISALLEAHAPSLNGPVKAF